MEKTKFTIEQIEEEIGMKLDYPNQFVDDMELPKYENFKNFGCSDIWDKNGHWLHRDCFSKHCHRCNFYPVLKAFEEKNKINPNIPPDITKAGFFDFFGN